MTYKTRMTKSVAANSSRGQMQIQQMAFVLVAIMIFFAMVALAYFSLRISSLKESAQSLNEDSAKELVRKLADSPELSWKGSSCNGCIDLDKALLIKQSKAYNGFWKVKYLSIEITYPNSTKVECTPNNYPDCSTITLVNEDKNYGTPESAFVSLCRWDSSNGGYTKCGIGKIYSSPREAQ